ncbi:beta strand repeat-containing protein, partial [Flavobacterium sp. XGLA_31]|uniref:beta strand repeat-containing protein n=1 Tax=Flavobacterium sp. XGLA_31 TaxID=3447666 RepID=UPI003F2FD4EE
MKKFLQIFLILFFVNVARSQEPNDCANAIMVCGNGSFVSDASGIGNTQEVNGCSGFEHNSIWLEIHVVQSGTLGFNIIPADTNITVDYDFWVYGPYGVNPPCPTTATSPIRCCTTNPQLAGLTSNVTGMNGSTLTTQSGPGANGNGYVRWLNVVAGQSYYIAIDRPVGDGGFQLDWIGSATAGTGAFAPPPTANTIPEYRQCSTSNVGIFQLSSVSSQVNANLTDNTVTYYASLSDAIAQLSELPDIMSSGPGPFTVYARVTDNITGCYSISSFDLVVYPIPVASLSVTNNAICSGDAVTVTISGTPNATIDYTVNSGAVQTAILNAAGTFSFSQALTTNTVYTLVSGRVLDPSGNPVCTQPLNDSETVTVNALPTATISGTASICSGNTAVITFNGTPNAIVTYTVDSSANQTITLDAAGTASVTTPVLTVNSTYNLISVALPTTPSCTQTLSGSASITVNSIPTATIAGTATVCGGTTTTITFNGTPNTTVTYTVDSGANQTIVLDNTGTATLTTPILNATTVYTLISVTNTVTNCTQVLSGSATITVIALPTATVSGSTTICSGNTATLTFTGTPNATVTYTVDSGANQSLALNGSGTATITTPILTSNSTYTLVSVASSGTPSCTQSLSTSTVITVVALPTASISGTTTICSGSTTTVTFTGTPNAVVTYTVDSGPNQTITLSGTGTASLTTPALITNSTYNLISVALSGTPACGQAVTGSATITVISSLTASISGTTSICSGNGTNITFNGTPNATITYTINSGANQTILLDGAGTASLTTPILNADTTYALVSVTSAGASPCSQAVSGSAVVTVSQTPTASISGTITICSGNTAPITFTGTPAATVTYTVDGGVNQTITLNAGGIATLNTPVLNANSTYNLVSVALGTAPVCSQTLSGSAIITVKPTPTIDTVLSNSMVCDGSSVTIPSFTSQPVGASFTWTNSNTNIGLAASGNGNIPTFTVSNTGTTAITATITVTPQLNGCTGNSVSFTITVNP